MTPEKVDATRRLQVARLMHEGLSWVEAIKTAKVRVHRTTAERWFHRLESKGEPRLAERRRGSAYMITPKIRAWLEKECRDDTNRTSAEICNRYFYTYNRLQDWRLAVGRIEDRLAVLVYDTAEQSSQPAYFILLTWKESKVSSIRDYLYARYVMHDA